MSVMSVELNSSMEMENKITPEQEPPCHTPGGGDISSKQRKVELQGLRFKSPVSESSPRSRGRAQKSQQSTEGEMRRRASSLHDRVQTPRVPRGRSHAASRRQSTPPRRASAELVAGRRVCQALALNAWRALRNKAARVHGDSAQLAAQLGGLKRQTATLRLLIDDEKLRVATAHEDAQRLTSLLAEGLEDRAQLVAQLERLDVQLEQAECRLVRAGEQRENFRNNLLTSTTSWTALDGLVSRSKAQLARLRADKQRLHEQIALRSDEIAAQQAEISAMQRRSEELQTQLDRQVDALRYADSEMTSGPIDDLEGLRTQLLEEAAGLRAQREQLTALLGVQAEQVASREKEIHELERELTSNLNTECDLRTRIAEVTARLSVTWYERARCAVVGIISFWLRTRGRLL